MRDEDRFRDLLPDDRTKRTAYPDFATFSRQIEDARADFRAALGLYPDPLPDIEPPLIPTDRLVRRRR